MAKIGRPGLAGRRGHGDNEAGPSVLGYRAPRQGEFKAPSFVYQLSGEYARGNAAGKWLDRREETGARGAAHVQESRRRSNSLLFRP